MAARVGRWRLFVMLGPAVMVLGVLFVGGLALGLLRSLNYMPLIGLTEPNLDAYVAIFTDRGFLASFALSFHIAFSSTLLSAVLAVGAALVLRETGPGRRVAMFLFQMNLTIPHVVGAIGILYLFSQSGFFARLAHGAGLIARTNDFPALVYDPNAIGIILLYVWKEVPFIGVVVLAQLQGASRDYEAIAQTLGAGPWQRFRHVTLPVILPGLMAASVMVFAFTFGAFEIPFLLGQSHPAALPVLAWRSYTDVDLAAKPAAMAMAMVIACMSAVMILAYLRLTRILGRRDLR